MTSIYRKKIKIEFDEHSPGMITGPSVPECREVHLSELVASQLAPILGSCGNYSAHHVLRQLDNQDVLIMKESMRLAGLNPEQFRDLMATLQIMARFAMHRGLAIIFEDIPGG